MFYYTNKTTVRDTVSVVACYTGCPNKNDLSLNVRRSANFWGTNEIFCVVAVDRLNNKRGEFHNASAIRSLFFKTSMLTLKYALFISILRQEYQMCQLGRQKKQEQM